MRHDVVTVDATRKKCRTCGQIFNKSSDAEVIAMSFGECVPLHKTAPSCESFEVFGRKVPE